MRKIFGNSTILNLPKKISYKWVKSLLFLISHHHHWHMCNSYLCSQAIRINMEIISKLENVFFFYTRDYHLSYMKSSMRYYTFQKVRQWRREIQLHPWSVWSYRKYNKPHKPQNPFQWFHNLNGFYFIIHAQLYYQKEYF